MSNLREQLDKASQEFVSAVLTAVRSASLQDLAAETERVAAPAPAAPRPRTPAAAAPAPAAAPRVTKRATAKGRRRRATADEVQAQKDRALEAANKLEPGFSKSDLMKKTGSKEDLGRALSLLVNEGLLIRRGERRLARYWVK